MTRLIVPYIEGMLRQETQSGVLRQYAAADLIRLPTGHDDAYALLLQQLFGDDRPFGVCEQDVVPPSQSIVPLLYCPEPWCTHPAWTGRQVDVNTLCLAKFRPRTLFPNADLIMPILGAPGRRRSRPWWGSLDTTIARELHKRGWTPHVHQPQVVHLHDYSHLT